MSRDLRFWRALERAILESSIGDAPMRFAEQEERQSDAPDPNWSDAEGEGAVLDEVEDRQQRFCNHQRHERQVSEDSSEQSVLLLNQRHVLALVQELLESSLQHTGDDDHQRQLKEHQLMETIPVIEGAANELSFDERPPNEVKSDCAVDNFVERPRAEEGVQQPKQDRVVDSIDAGHDEEFLSDAAAARRRDAWTVEFSICGR